MRGRLGASLCNSVNNRNLDRSSFTKVQRDASSNKSLAFTAINPKLSGDFRPSEEIFNFPQRTVGCP